MQQNRGVAIVTGAEKGIGYAIAEALNRAGFIVVGAGLGGPRNEQADSPSPLASYFELDLSDIASHAAVLSRVTTELGPVTCLINNAGVTSLVRGDMLELTPESFDRSVGVNLRGTFFLTQAVARRMVLERSKQYRSIITISSANAEIVGENRADYCMTKSALAMMSKLFAARLAQAEIGVFEIRPGIIKTDMTAPAAGRYDPFIQEGGVPMRRWGQPADVAQAVATLARGDIPFATGIHIDVGGGLQLHRV